MVVVDWYVIYWYKLFVICVLTAKWLTIRRGCHFNWLPLRWIFCAQGRLLLLNLGLYNCRACYFVYLDNLNDKKNKTHKKQKKQAQLWKQSFKCFEKESHQIGPNFIADQFGLPNKSEREPCWVHNRRVVLEWLPPAERNILLTGDPDLKFDLFNYIWCYTYPQFAVINSVLQEHFSRFFNSKTIWREIILRKIILKFPYQ